MNIHPISIKFLHDAAAEPLANSKGKKQNRIQFEDLDDKTYLVAAKYGFKEKIPKLNFIEKKFNVIVNVEKDGKTGYIVVNKNSLLKRLNLSSEDLKNSLSKNKKHDVTEAVSKKINEIKKELIYKKNIKNFEIIEEKENQSVKINEKKEFKSIPQFFAEAEEQFSLHPLKDEILLRLNDILVQTMEKNSFSCGNEKIAPKESAIEDALESFFDRKDLFPDLDIVKEGGVYLGTEQMKRMIMKEAEIFTKEKVKPEEQKNVLNYIRSVTYNRNFLNGTVGFFHEWAETIDSSNESSERAAFAFFDYLRNK
jgi:hypothetical protein